MILRYVGLCLDTVEYEPICGDFGFRCRYLGNFLGRAIKPLRFHADRFGAIVVRGMLEPAERCSLREVNVLRAPVRFDRERYESLGPNEHHEFFIGMLSEGLEKCVPDFKIPIKELREGIEEFRRGGYKNEWTHQSKLLRPHGIRASLLCKMESERFVLTLVLERKDEVLFKESILETKPDELCFYYLFKDITIKDDTIIITNRFSALQEPLLRLDIRPLLANQ